MEITITIYATLLCIGGLNICVAVYALFYYTSKTPESKGYSLTPQVENI